MAQFSFELLNEFSEEEVLDACREMNEELLRRNREDTAGQVRTCYRGLSNLLALAGLLETNPMMAGGLIDTALLLAQRLREREAHVH